MYAKNLNETPTDLQLSSSKLEDKVQDGSKVATLSTKDPDNDDTHAYLLSKGKGSKDNTKFKIEDDKLFILETPDFKRNF